MIFMKLIFDREGIYFKILLVFLRYVFSCKDMWGRGRLES